MTVGQWLAGYASVLLTIAAVATLGSAVRRRTVPEVRGAAGLLVVWTAGISVAVAGAQLLGAVALFRRSAIDVVAALVVIGGWRARRRGGRDRAPRTGPTLTPSGAAAAVAVVLVLAVWVARAIRTLHWGVLWPDSIDYELPLATSFVQTHRIGPLHLVTPGSPTAYYPQGELVEQGFGMLALHRDVMAPLLSLADAVLALLAGAVLGRRLRVAAPAVAAVALVLALPIIVATNAGQVKEDAAVLAWLLAALALAAHALPEHGRGLDRRWLVPTGLALGMAVDVKLTAVPSAAAIVLGLVLLGGRRGALRSTAVLLAALLPTGAFWYVRNLVLVGNPFVGAHVPGLPSARFSLLDAYGRSLARALLSTPRSLAHSFGPYVGFVLSVVWPAVIALAVLGAVAAAVPRTGLLRRSQCSGDAGRASPGRRPPALLLVGVTAVVTIVTFLVTPTTAGPVGDPHRLGLSNARYAAPALAMGIVALVAVCGPALAFVSTAVVAGLAVVVAVEPWHLDVHVPNRADGALVAAVLLVVGVVGVVLLRLRPDPRALATLGVLGALVGAAGGQPVADRIVHDRYAARSGAAPQWSALAGTSGLRVAVVGSPLKYPAFGAHLDNVVDYLGTRTPHGGMEVAAGCAEVRRQLAAGHYDLLLFAPTDQSAAQGLSVDTLTPLTVGAVIPGPVLLAKVAPDVGSRPCPD